MFTKKVTRSVALPIILASYLTSTIADAQPDQQSGERRGPPQQAIEACAGQSEGASCAFSGHRGDVAGTCIVPPGGQDLLACAPEGGPPQQQRGK